MGLFDTVFVRLQNAWFAARDEESGQTLIEYALIISLIGIGVIAALIFFRDRLVSLFSSSGSSLPG